MTWLFIAIAFGLYFLYLAINQSMTAQLETLTKAFNQRLDKLSDALKGKTDDEEDGEEDGDDDDLMKRVEAQVYKDPSRYFVHDEYTRAEMHRRYDLADVRGRIRFLEQLLNETVPPFDFMRKVVNDPSSEVREWVARQAGNLDYREIRYVKGETTYKYPDRDLTEVLRADSDPFVRAALRENPNAMHLRYNSDECESEFLSCNKMERLALLRNKNVNFALIEKILNLENEDLGLSLDERVELGTACVSNPHLLENSRRSRAMDFPDGYSWYRAGKEAETVWRLVAKWPEGPLQHATYKYVQTSDEVKAEVYAKTDSKHLRAMILEGCTPADFKTVELGRTDSDETNRYIALSRTHHLSDEEIERILKIEKDWISDELFTNPWLKAQALVVKEKIDAEKENASSSAHGA